MNIDTSLLQFAVRSDLCIVGSNPEMAEAGNPRGDLEGMVHYVMAEAPDGRRWVHDASAVTRNGCAVSEMTVERLERLALYLNNTHPSLNSDHWSEADAVYGSEAYMREG